MSVITGIITSSSNPSSTVFEGAWVTATDYNKNEQVANGGDLFICSTDHTSAALTEPGTGANWTDKWARQVDMLPSSIIDATAGEGTPSGSNKFTTKTYVDTTSICVTATAGETLSQYSVVYAKSDGKYWKADANTSITTADACGIVLQSGGITANATGSIQIKPGLVTNAAWAWTIHSSLYLGTAGAIVESASALAFTKPIGYAETATQIYFYPQTGWSNTELVSGLSSYQLVIEYTPDEYTPEVVASCTLTTQLAAHLKGINEELATIRALIT
jgi:hypothetical protein